MSWPRSVLQWSLRLVAAALLVLIILSMVPIRPTVPAIQPRDGA